MAFTFNAANDQERLINQISTFPPIIQERREHGSEEQNLDKGRRGWFKNTQVIGHLLWMSPNRTTTKIRFVLMSTLQDEK